MNEQTEKVEVEVIPPAETKKEETTELVKAENNKPQEEKKEAVQNNAFLKTADDIWGSLDGYRAAATMASALSKADIVPEGYRNKSANCLIALDFAKRMNISPMMVMQNLYIVSGTPAWSGQACIALINNCGKFSPLRFKEMYKSDTEFSCTAYATDLETKEIITGTTVDYEMTVKMGWSTRSNSYWKKMPMQMARYRAATYFARAYCPECLMGLYTRDEQADIKQNYDEPIEEVLGSNG